ncbi:MAG: CDP-glucose 4,6-dehydratase [bacterium]|nr:CDP-glucose 4,6-dehydratase [bacterium]
MNHSASRHQSPATNHQPSITKLFGSIYLNRKVLITGHTGFKGSWLSLWLTQMGADLCGYSLEPPTSPNHFDLLNLDMRSEIGDIRDKEKLNNVFKSFKPEIVFHLAAQPLVRLSYKEPIETLETNIIGTANVFEACKQCDSVKTIINITSDKCYENKEWIWGYKENDPMGGYDPYSVSKGCSELITSCYRNSYFNLNEYGKSHNILLASCRAGNVIGGGDWAEDRLIPDIMKAVSEGKTVEIRNPNATRPWQHVLEPLNGYLSVGQKLLEGKKEFAEAWNFGPDASNTLTVGEVVNKIKDNWPDIKYNLGTETGPHEAGLLKLDSSKALIKLKWKPKWDAGTTFEKTTLWYNNFYNNKIINSHNDLNDFTLNI